MRALAKKLSLNLRKPAASFGVSSSRSAGVDCFAPLPLLGLLFISADLHLERVSRVPGMEAVTLSFDDLVGEF